MPEHDLQRLWALLDAQGDHRGLAWGAKDILTAARECGIPVSPEDLWAVGKGHFTRGGEYLTPPLVAHFVAALVATQPGRRILDPWVCAGTMLTTLARALDPAEVIGLHPSQEAVQTASLLMAGLPARCMTADLDDTATGRALGEFDVIASDLPLNAQRRRFRVGATELEDSLESEILLRSAVRLSADGVAVYVTGPRFLVDPRRGSVAQRLPEFGLRVDAWLYVPPGTYSPFTSIPRTIVVVRRGTQDESLFVGEVTSDPERRRTLLRNLSSRTSGGPPALGTCVPLKGFGGFQRLAAEHRLAELTSRLPFPRRPLSEIALSIERLERSPEPNEVGDNVVYIPLIAASRVRLAGEALPRGIKEVAVVKVDPAKADARMVAAFLESELGREIRASRASGVTIQRQRFDELPDLPLWLPSPDEQRRIVALDQRLRSVAGDVEELRGALWDRPDRAAGVAERLNHINREDSLTDWMDTLPFPLASILWTAEAAADEPHRRLAQLDYFFEALAEFLAVLLLSASRGDSGALSADLAEVRSSLRGRRISLDRPSFGTWVTIVEGLAPRIAKEIASSDELRGVWQRRTACDSRDLLAALCSTNLMVLLKRANQYRNDWRGHGGVASDSEMRLRAGTLKDLVLELKNLVGRRWSAYPLVLPGRGVFSAGWHRYAASVVMGSRVPFAQAEYRLQRPMEDGVLHVVGPTSGDTCALLPLVRVAASPGDAKNACYFFNRLNGPSARFVSYHYEGQPELTETASADLTELTALLGKL